MFPFGMQVILGIICTPERNILEYYAWGCNKVGKLISCDTGWHQRENCGVENMQRCLPNLHRVGGGLGMSVWSVFGCFFLKPSRK